MTLNNQEIQKDDWEGEEYDYLNILNNWREDEYIKIEELKKDLFRNLSRHLILNKTNVIKYDAKRILPFKEKLEGQLTNYSSKKERISYLSLLFRKNLSSENHYRYLLLGLIDRGFKIFKKDAFGFKKISGINDLLSFKLKDMRSFYDNSGNQYHVFLSEITPIKPELWIRLNISDWDIQENHFVLWFITSIRNVIILDSSLIHRLIKNQSNYINEDWKRKGINVKFNIQDLELKIVKVDEPDFKISAEKLINKWSIINFNQSKLDIENQYPALSPNKALRIILDAFTTLQILKRTRSERDRLRKDLKGDKNYPYSSNLSLSNNEIIDCFLKEIKEKIDQSEFETITDELNNVINKRQALYLIANREGTLISSKETDNSNVNLQRKSNIDKNPIIDSKKRTYKEIDFSNLINKFKLFSQVNKGTIHLSNLYQFLGIENDEIFFQLLSKMMTPEYEQLTENFNINWDKRIISFLETHRKEQD